MYNRRLLSFLLATIMVLSLLPATVFSVSAASVSGPVPLDEPIRLVSSTGDGAFLPAQTMVPGSDTCFTVVFDIAGATDDDPYSIGGVTGNLNGINPNNSGNMPVGWNVSFTGNGYKYLSVGWYFWQWNNITNFEINSLSLSDPSGTRSAATDVGNNSDATFELVDIIKGSPAYDITYKSEDGSVTYSQETGTVTGCGAYSYRSGSLPSVADLYTGTLPEKTGTSGAEYQFNGWVDENGNAVEWAYGTQTVYASFREIKALSVVTEASAATAGADDVVNVTVTPDLSVKKVRNGVMTLAYNADMFSFVSGSTGSGFTSLDTVFSDNGAGEVTITYSADADITGTTGEMFSLSFKVHSLAGPNQSCTFVTSAQDGACTDSDSAYVLIETHANAVVTMVCDGTYSVYENGINQSAQPFTTDRIALIGEDGLYDGTYTTHSQQTTAIGFLYDVTGVTSDVTIGDVYGTFYKSGSSALQNTNSSSSNINTGSQFATITQDGRYFAWFGNAFLTYSVNSYLDSFTQFNISDALNATKFTDTVNPNTNATFRLVGIAEASTTSLPSAVVTFKSEDGQVLQTYTANYAGGATNYWVNKNIAVPTLSSVYTGMTPVKESEDGVAYHFIGWKTADGDIMTHADRTMTVYPYFSEFPAMQMTASATGGTSGDPVSVSVGFSENAYDASTVVFDVAYNSDVFTYTGITCDLTDATVSAVDNGTGTVTVTVSCAQAVSAQSASLATLTFASSESAHSGTYAFTVTGNETLTVTTDGRAYAISGTQAGSVLTRPKIYTYYDYENNQPSGALSGAVIAPAEKWNSNPHKDVTLGHDGNQDTYWQCSGQNYYTAKLQYYGFDFGGEALLSEITFKAGNYTAAYGGLRLEVSSDGTVWNTIWSDAAAAYSGQTVTVNVANWNSSYMGTDNSWKYIRLSYGDDTQYCGWDMLRVYELSASGQVSVPEERTQAGFISENPTPVSIPAAAVSGGIKLIGSGSLYESATGNSAYTFTTGGHTGFTVALRFEGIESPITLSNWNGNWRNFQATNAGNGLSRYTTTVSEDGYYLFFFPINNITWMGNLGPFTAAETINSLQFFDANNTGVGTASANANENAKVSLLGIYEGNVADFGITYEVNDGDQTGRYYYFGSTGITGADGTSASLIKQVKLNSTQDLFLSAMPKRGEPAKATEGQYAYIYNGWKNADGVPVDTVWYDSTVYVSFVPQCIHLSTTPQITKQPTCTEEGIRSYICDNCHESAYTESIPATGHTAGEPVTTPPTCTADGSVITYCTVCGQAIETQIIPALGHDYTAVITKAATYLNTGIKTYTCSVCSDSYTEILPVLTITDSSPKLTVSNANAIAGGIVRVPVILSGNPGVKQIAFQVDAAEGLTLTGVENGKLLPNMSASQTSSEVVLVGPTWTGAGNVTANGTLVTLTFTVEASAAADAQYEVSILPLAGNDNEYAKDTQDNVVALAGISGTVTVVGHEHTAVISGADPVSYWHPYFGGDTVCSACGAILTSGQMLDAQTVTADSPLVKVEITPESVTGSDTFTAVISLVNNPGLSGLQFDLQYDDTAFDITGVQFGTLFSYQSSSSGSPVTFLFDSSLDLEPVSANGVLVSVTFAVKDTAASGEKQFEIALSDGTQEPGYDYNLNPVSLGAVNDSLTLSVSAQPQEEADNAQYPDNSTQALPVDAMLLLSKAGMNGAGRSRYVV